MNCGLKHICWSNLALHLRVEISWQPFNQTIAQLKSKWCIQQPWLTASHGLCCEALRTSGQHTAWCGAKYSKQESQETCILGKKYWERNPFPSHRIPFHKSNDFYHSSQGFRSSFPWVFMYLPIISQLLEKEPFQIKVKIIFNWLEWQLDLSLPYSPLSSAICFCRAVSFCCRLLGYFLRARKHFGIECLDGVEHMGFLLSEPLTLS